MTSKGWIQLPPFMRALNRSVIKICLVGKETVKDVVVTLGPCAVSEQLMSTF